MATDKAQSLPLLSSIQLDGKPKGVLLIQKSDEQVKSHSTQTYTQALSGVWKIYTLKAGRNKLWAYSNAARQL